MGRRAVNPVELIRTEASIHFDFLVSGEGFAGPELTERGVCYSRADFDVEIIFSDYSGRDLEVVTWLVVLDENGQRLASMALKDAYVACGLGPPQDVPGSAQTLRALAKHLALQALALRQLMHFLNHQSPRRAQDRPASWFQS